MKKESMIIIGGGFAGLATGIYARLNGYKTRIFELHDKPGGLCTSWDRKGYTFDGCIHWLVGSSEKSGMHDFWEETGVSQDREFINMEEYYRIEDPSGKTLVLYTDIDRLQKHMLQFAPEDEKAINEFINGIRLCLPFDMPSKKDSFFTRLGKMAQITSMFVFNAGKMKKWMNLTAEDFSKRFTNPVLREAFMTMWIPEFSMFFMLFTFAYMHNRNAGYPIGGSMPMAKAMEKRYISLGGEISYKQRVSKILTEDGRASGVLLEDGTRHIADRVISAADGYSTLFKMLDEKYVDEKSREPYGKWLIFPPLIYISLGVNRTFDELPHTISGISFKLKLPTLIGDKVHERISVHIFNYDPTLAPVGKTAVTIMLKTDYSWWKDLSVNKDVYKSKKKEIADTVIKLLEERFPGITEQIEVIDVATPLTFERYTGNWKGSFEGWLITPENSSTLMKPMSQTLPGLKDFYMCGQWVEPGGGLPTALMSARRLMKKICKEDGEKFRSEG